MARRYSIFLDDGGVLNDNSKREEPWQQLVAEFFVPRFGGKPDQWEEANKVAIGQWIEVSESLNPDLTTLEVMDELDKKWLVTMFEIVGIPSPSDEEILPLVRESVSWITPKVHAAFPGIIEVVKSLWKEKFPLYTASAGPSWTIEGYIKGMGLDHCFIKYYGPDLIQTLKRNPKYYEKVFKDSQVQPENAIVVDDMPARLFLAQESGAQVIQSCSSGNYEPELPLFYTKSEDLFDLIMRLEEDVL